tara:strand:+ start:1422 stop:1841 length:420 start_codon:yes stop_codon:yes gene_type:complete
MAYERMVAYAYVYFLYVYQYLRHIQMASINMSMIPVTLTDSARDYLRQALTSHPQNEYVSLSVKGGGCSGMQYVWGFSTEHPDVSWSEPIDQILVVDPMAEMFLIGSEIDYVTELGGSFLKINNPTATSSCGCGESFAA